MIKFNKGIVCTTESLKQQIGGMRVVDQNYLYLRSLMEKPQNTNLMTVSSNLTEGTKDDTKRRMTDAERRVVRVHTK